MALCFNAGFGRRSAWPSADLACLSGVTGWCRSTSSLHSGLSGSGTGTSYATVHVAAAAAMWLRRHGPELAARYAAPWQRGQAAGLGRLGGL